MSRQKVWPVIPRKTLERWYWDEFLSVHAIAKRWRERCKSVKWPKGMWVSRLLRHYGIPRRSMSEGTLLDHALRLKLQDRDRRFGPLRAHRVVYENEIGEIPKDFDIHHEDQVKGNNHPINLKAKSKSTHTRDHKLLRNKPKRIPIFEVYMRMACEIAGRSHHGMTKVGCIITNFQLTKVLGVGFNGNAAGLEHEPDSTKPGNSGLIHAECNAIVKAGHGERLVAFISHSPCMICMKLLHTAGVRYLYFRAPYRELLPVKIARYLGMQVCQYDKWQNTNW